LISRAKEKSRGIAFLLARPFIACGAPPLAVSLLGVPLALAFAFFVLRQDFLAAFPFGFLAVLADLLDGEVARRQKKDSPFGNYLEGTIDKAVDFILIGCFVFLSPLAAVLALGCSFLVSFAKPRVALVIITDNRDWPGIGERGDKLVLLLLGVLLAAFQPNVFGFETITLMLYLVALIAFAGFLQRVSYAKKLIEQAERSGNILPYLKKK